MIYTIDCKTETTHTIASPLHSVLKVSKGLVYKVEAQFPSGCAGLCHLIICDGSFQVWPSTRGETWHPDGFIISFEDTYLKRSAPYQFDIYTYNLDEKYPHTPQVRIGLVTEEIFMARFLPTIGFEHFLRMLTEWQATQNERLEEARVELLEKPFTWYEEEY